MLRPPVRVATTDLGRRGTEGDLRQQTWGLDRHEPGAQGRWDGMDGHTAICCFVAGPPDADTQHGSPLFLWAGNLDWPRLGLATPRGSEVGRASSPGPGSAPTCASCRGPSLLVAGPGGQLPSPCSKSGEGSGGGCCRLASWQCHPCPAWSSWQEVTGPLAFRDASVQVPARCLVLG